MPLAPAPLLLLLAQADAPELRIDPLLLAAVTEVFGVIARDDNPLWPGWNAADTPVLLYLPGVQDALLNHPRPPAGFRRVTSPLLPSGWTLDLRDGTTQIELDGQNTSTQVNGIETLVVADPISNLRPGLALLLDDPRPVAERTRELTARTLDLDPYDELALVVHEAFHVHQFRRAPSKGASEGWLLAYPWLAAENNAHFELEGRTLARALSATDPEEAYEVALEWLAVRRARRGGLPAQAVAYEDGTEFNEGLAKYVEWRASEAFEGRASGPGLRWARGFHGFERLDAWRARLRQALLGNCNGEVVVNGDPYGSGGLRFRLYYTGMAIGVLLDRLEVEGWHERILAPGTTLTGLVEEALVPDDADLEAALAQAREAGNYAACLARCQTLERGGQAAAEAALQRILAGPALLTLDHAGVDAQVGFAFTPFGLTKIDPARTIYGQIPLRAELGQAASFQQDAISPVLHDTQARRISFQLARPLAAGELARLLGREPAGVLEDLDLSLPGVHLEARRARLRAVGGGVEIVLVP